MQVEKIVGENFADVLAISSLSKLSKLYKIGKDTLKQYIFTNPKLDEIYRSKARKDLIYHRKHDAPVRKRKRRKEEEYEYCPTFFSPLVGSSCKQLSETVIRKAIEDEDKTFFESGWYIFFQNMTSLTTTKEEYLKMINERQCRE